MLLSYALPGEDNPVVALPDTWQGLPVTRIAEDAFAGEPIERLTLPKYVTGLTAMTFIGAQDLVWIDVPKAAENYMSINGVLYNKEGTELIYCPSASATTARVLPDTVRTIGAYAFYGQQHLARSP